MGRKRIPVFLIVKYSVTFSEEYKSSEYAQVNLMPDRRTIKENVIEPRKAREIIAENGMVEALNNEYGRVWELPGISFKKRFRGKYLNFND